MNKLLELQGRVWDTGVESSQENYDIQVFKDKKPNVQQEESLKSGGMHQYSSVQSPLQEIAQ